MLLELRNFFYSLWCFFCQKKYHFQLKHLWTRCGWSYYSYSYIHAFYLISSTFCPLHDKHFETDKKISCRIDESITILDNTIHRLIRWIDKIDESIFLYLAPFFWRKLNLIYLCFVHYRMTQLRYFCCDNFLNNFRLPVGFVETGLFIGDIWLLHHDHWPEDLNTFSVDKYSSITFLILLSHGTSIIFFLLNNFSFSFLFVLTLEHWIFSHVLANFFPSF